MNENKCILGCLIVEIMSVVAFVVTANPYIGLLGVAMAMGGLFATHPIYLH